MTPCHGMLYSSRSISTLNRAPVHTAAEGQPDGYATLIGQIGRTMEMGRPGRHARATRCVADIPAATERRLGDFQQAPRSIIDDLATASRSLGLAAATK